MSKDSPLPTSENIENLDDLIASFNDSVSSLRSSELSVERIKTLLDQKVYSRSFQLFYQFEEKLDKGLELLHTFFSQEVRYKKEQYKAPSVRIELTTSQIGIPNSFVDVAIEYHESDFYSGKDDCLKVQITSHYQNRYLIYTDPGNGVASDYYFCMKNLTLSSYPQTSWHWFRMAKTGKMVREAIAYRRSSHDTDPIKFQNFYHLKRELFENYGNLLSSVLSRQERQDTPAHKNRMDFTRGYESFIHTLTSLPQILITAYQKKK